MSSLSSQSPVWQTQAHTHAYTHTHTCKCLDIIIFSVQLSPLVPVCSAILWMDFFFVPVVGLIPCLSSVGRDIPRGQVEPLMAPCGPGEYVEVELGVEGQRRMLCERPVDHSTMPGVGSIDTGLHLSSCSQSVV